MTGRELTRQAALRGIEAIPLSRTDLDITDSSATIRAVKKAKPDLVINSAGYTAVDEAERMPLVAAEVNDAGAANVARAAAETGAAMIQISSDYVFDGSSPTPYTPESATNPLNVYGATKLAGENRVRQTLDHYLIVRTSWVFSHEGRNFLRTMLRLGRDGAELRIVGDQRGCPTLAGDLAAALLDAGVSVAHDKSLSGTYHYCNAGETTWFGFARSIFEELAVESPVLTEITSDEFGAAAVRPHYSVLDSSAFSTAFGVAPRQWLDALKSIRCLVQ